MKAAVLAVVWLALCGLSHGVERYDGHQVLHVDLRTDAQMEAVRAMDVDVWSSDSQIVRGINDIRVTPAQRAKLESLNITSEVMISDVQAAVEATFRRANTSKHHKKGNEWFTQYHAFEDTIAWYEARAQEHSSIASMKTVGSTVNNREIYVFVINALPHEGKKKAYIQAALHAREWISPSTTAWIVNELLTLYGTDPQVTKLLNEVELHVAPCSNPDGYDYSFVTSRLWRKNRRNNGGGSYGVDLNRNWDYQWNCCGGSSGSPNSDTYRGPSAKSEPEVAALDAYLRAEKMQGALDMHSYTQLFLRAWGWTRTDTPDEAATRALGDAMKDAVFNGGYNTVYTNQKSIDLYLTDGTASDWFYAPEAGNAKYSYTVELRDRGQYGFLLPPEQIIPSGEETYAAVMVWLAKIADES